MKFSQVLKRVLKVFLCLFIPVLLFCILFAVYPVDAAEGDSYFDISSFKVDVMDVSGTWSEFTGFKSIPSLSQSRYTLYYQTDDAPLVYGLRFYFDCTTTTPLCFGFNFTFDNKVGNIDLMPSIFVSEFLIQFDGSLDYVRYQMDGDSSVYGIVSSVDDTFTLGYRWLSTQFKNVNQSADGVNNVAIDFRFETPLDLNFVPFNFSFTSLISNNPDTVKSALGKLTYYYHNFYTAEGNILGKSVLDGTSALLLLDSLTTQLQAFNTFVDMNNAFGSMPNVLNPFLVIFFDSGNMLSTLSYIFVTVFVTVVLLVLLRRQPFGGMGRRSGK